MERRKFIQHIALGSGCILFAPLNSKCMNLNKDAFKLFIPYNNTGNDPKLECAWGLSVWIENGNEAILFDTGGDASILWKNVENSGLDLTKLSKIVISHNHWDHKNGLRLILEKTDYKPDVYIVENDYDEFKSKFPEAIIKSVSNAEQIDTNIWTTGQLKGLLRGVELNEQSLVLTQNDTMVVITGCSHSGIVKMSKTIKELFPDKRIALLAGGFHLVQKSESEIMDISNNLKKMDVHMIAPSHCTGQNAIDIFKAEWGENFVDLNLGEETNI